MNLSVTLGRYCESRLIQHTIYIYGWFLNKAQYEFIDVQGNYVSCYNFGIFFVIKSADNILLTVPQISKYINAVFLNAANIMGYR